MGPMGRMGPMIMGLWDEGTILWETMGLWDDTTQHAARSTHFPPAPCTLFCFIYTRLGKKVNFSLARWVASKKGSGHKETLTPRLFLG